MKNITADQYCHLLKVENRAECEMGWRIEDGGIFLSATRHALEMLSTDELDAVTLGMGTRVLTVPLLAFPCSIGELHDFLLKLGEPGIDADDYAKAFRQNGRFTYTDDLPDGTHIPLSMWIQALAERAAVRRGIEPWSDDGWEFLNRWSRLVQDQSGTLPLRLLSSELLAQPPLDLLRDDYVVRKDEGLRWLAEHAQEFAEPVAQVAAPAGEAVTIAGPGKMGNTTKGRRTHPLGAEIEAARREATNPDDFHSVFAVLQRWAEARRAPFIGFAEGEGCKYEKAAGTVAFFKSSALRKRMNRAANAR